MVYSDTTTKNGIIQRIEAHGELGDGVISGDTDLLKMFTVNVNESLNEIILEIMLAQDSFDWDDPTRTDYPVATTPLIAGQRDYQFDGLSFLKIKRVDVSWDGSKYYRATPFDSGAYQGGLGNDIDVDGNFPKTEPRYDPKSFGFWLYPRATAAEVAAGGKIRIEYIRAFDAYTYDDTTKEPPVASPFHDLIAIGAALRYNRLSEKTRQNLTKMWEQGILRLRSYYGKRDEDMTLVFNPIIQNYG